MNDSEQPDLRRFGNRLRILRSIDLHEIPQVLDWPAFRDNPSGYFIRCADEEAEQIWLALRRREPEPFKLKEEGK